jgi:hypothetical protein
LAGVDQSITDLTAACSVNGITDALQSAWDLAGGAAMFTPKVSIAPDFSSDFELGNKFSSYVDADAMTLLPLGFGLVNLAVIWVQNPDQHLKVCIEQNENISYSVSAC